MLGGVQRGRAEFGDVGQDRRFHAAGEQLVHLKFGDGFRENHVGAGFDAGSGAIQGRLQAFHRQGVGTGHDHEAVIGTGIDGRLDAIDHFLLGHDFLVRTVTAALGADLVFDVNRRRAELDHRLHGTGDVERRGTETGVHVHQQRQVANIGDTAHVGQHVIQAGDAQVRQAEGAGSHPATRQVDRLETGALGQQRMVGVDCADHLQWMFAGDRIAETLAWSALVQTHDSPRLAVGLAPSW
ncbi:hypothetical protein D3C78_1020440 [compost metagenome]